MGENSDHACGESLNVGIGLFVYKIYYTVPSMLLPNNVQYKTPY